MCQVAPSRSRRFNIITKLYALAIVVMQAIQNAIEARDAVQKAKKTRKNRARPDYRQSTWWRMLADGRCKDPETPEHQLFRRRFTVPFTMYADIVKKARDWGVFPKDGDTDASGRPAVPLELKVLGALRYLGKGVCFDAIAELSGMSEQTAQNFFHKFWRRFVDEFKDQWIKYPTTAEEAKQSLEDYAALGYPGAVASVDVTHVGWAMCPARWANFYKNGKNKVPTVAYECAVSKRGRVLYVSDGHPGTRSDKAIAKTDIFVQDVLQKRILQDVTFKLRKVDGTQHEVTGAWLITDNGYTKVRSMQCPIKHCSSQQEYDYSLRLESVRKDVEAFFGRLKIRFRLLRGNVNFHKQRKVDACFFAACILHNMLHEADGLDQGWAGGTQEDEDIRAAYDALRSRRRQAEHAREVVDLPDNPLYPPEVGEEDGEDREEDHFFSLSLLLIERYT